MLSLHANLVTRSGGFSLPLRSPTCRAKRSVVSRQKSLFSIRNLSTPSGPSADYKPSYDPRVESKPLSWPQSREEELLELAKKVHPDAIVRKASSNDFSFRVRAGARRVPSAPADIVGDIKGLLKPPAIMRGTDPQDVKAREKRRERRAKLVAALAASNDIVPGALSPARVNNIHTQLRELDLEDVKAGYEPTFFTSADLDTSIIAPFPISSSRSTLFQSTTMPFNSSDATSIDATQSIWSSKTFAERNSNRSSNSTSKTASNDSPWYIADSPIRRRFIRDLIANAEEMSQLEKDGLLHSSSASSNSTTLERLNQLSVRRIFAIVMQTALVLPWAIGRNFASATKPDFWAFERKAAEARPFAETDAHVAELQRRLDEMREYKNKIINEQPGARNFFYLRTAAWQFLYHTVRAFTVYPARALYAIVREAAIFAYFVCMGPFLLGEQLYRRFILPNYGKSRLLSPIAVAWGGLAPITWKRYAAGDNLGTLWDRQSGHSEEILQHQRHSFNRIGYGVEKTIFGLFHNNRVLGLAALVLIAGIISAAAFDIDPEVMASMANNERHNL